MTRLECLAAAQAAVNGREKAYGSPAAAFKRTGDLWAVILGHQVTPAQVALCLAALKLARLIETPSHPDSWVDLAGYAACGAEVAP